MFCLAFSSCARCLLQYATTLRICGISSSGRQHSNSSATFHFFISLSLCICKKPTSLMRSCVSIMVQVNLPSSYFSGSLEGFFFKTCMIFRPLVLVRLAWIDMRVGRYLSWPMVSPEPSSLAHPEEMDCSSFNQASSSGAVMLTSSLNSLIAVVDQKVDVIWEKVMI